MPIAFTTLFLSLFFLARLRLCLFISIILLLSCFSSLSLSLTLFLLLMRLSEGGRDRERWWKEDRWGESVFGFVSFFCRCLFVRAFVVGSSTATPHCYNETRKLFHWCAYRVVCGWVHTENRSTSEKEKRSWQFNLRRVTTPR